MYWTVNPIISTDGDKGERMSQKKVINLHLKHEEVCLFHLGKQSWWLSGLLCAPSGCLGAEAFHFYRNIQTDVHWTNLPRMETYRTLFIDCTE